MSDVLEQHRAFATVLHLYQIPCPGPRDGMVLTTILGQLDDAMHRPDVPPSVVRALQAYYDGLLAIAGIWMTQQKLVIDRVASMVDSAAEKT